MDKGQKKPLYSAGEERNAVMIWLTDFILQKSTQCKVKRQLQKAILCNIS